MEGILNLDYVIAIKESDKKFVKIEIPISKPSDLINNLTGMVNNESKTAWDMYSVFKEFYPKKDYPIDYIYPNEYCLPFVNTPCYPKMKSKEHIEKQILDAESRSCGNQRQHKGSLSESDLQKMTYEAKRTNKKIKEEYFERMINWINAVEYKITFNNLSKDQDIKMISRENVGFNTYKHQISEDLSVTLNTNFGYGHSSYFFLQIEYKGIKILPYSFLTNYYYANTVQISRFTRNFNVSRHSWNYAFDYVSKSSTEAKNNPESFILKYILEEVEKMMRGLEEINTSPVPYIEKIKYTRPLPFVAFIGCWNDNDSRKMALYPKLFPILFKVEKLSGALEFISNLNQLSEYFPKLSGDINRIQKINRDLIPEIESTIKEIKISLEKTEKELEKKNSEKEICLKELETYEELIARRKNNDPNSFNIETFKKENPQYEYLLKHKFKLNEEINDLTIKKGDFNSFISYLSSVEERITTFKIGNN